MQSSGIFEWLGHVLGAVIRALVHALEFVLGGVRSALGAFGDGFARALGMRPSTFNFVWLVLGLLILVVSVRAFRRRSIVAGIIWLVIALLLLGKLIH